MTGAVPKAVLYYAKDSVWSTSALLALEEKGYGADEVDLRIVELDKGENFAPSFLRLNPKATVPTLVVPLQKTLSEDVESRYKAISESKDIAVFLDKSRSALSRTHTTSTAPAPALAPATIAFSAISIAIVDTLHSEQADPATLKYMSAFDDDSLRALGKDVLPRLVGKKDALAQQLSAAESEEIHISEKVKSFWREKKAAVEILLQIFTSADTPSADLDASAKQRRDEYFQTSKTLWGATLKEILTKLSKEMIGPYVLGDQLSIADLHLAPWLARVIDIVGGSDAEDGAAVVAKIEARIGQGFSLPKDFHTESERQGVTQAEGQSKLAAFWDAIRERPSWKKVHRQV
ncbi:hypothetical protein HGRIS_007946 [Hohenbuehelia grisea]|uniref:GST N-terminal domain-containing protein n=1 Tax=Hohenbuehelia grisea TaxID=104357 RepID=A0ABR3J6X4_9AGAR